MNTSKDTDGNSTKRKQQGGATGDDQPQLPQLGGSERQPSPGDRSRIGFHMVEIIHRDDGYLKIRRELDSAQMHLTWTWTMGQWARCYVYVRVEYYAIGFGLGLLMDKITEVDHGLRVPTPDKYLRP